MTCEFCGKVHEDVSLRDEDAERLSCAHAALRAERERAEKAERERDALKNKYDHACGQIAVAREEIAALRAGKGKT